MSEPEKEKNIEDLQKEAFDEQIRILKEKTQQKLLSYNKKYPTFKEEELLIQEENERKRLIQQVQEKERLLQNEEVGRLLEKFDMMSILQKQIMEKEIKRKPFDPTLLELGNLIGKGGFGTVYELQDQDYVVKRNNDSHEGEIPRAPRH